MQLAQAGLVTICPRCFLWEPDAAGNVVDYNAQVARFRRRQPAARGMAKMLFDARRAVDVLTGIPDVDHRRLAAIGHSLGGKEALYLAALDERIVATAASEFGIGMTYSNWDAPWYLGPEIHEARFPRRHHELLGMIAPRAFLLVAGESADGDRSWPYLAAAREIYDLYPGPARWGFLNHRTGHAPPAEVGRKMCQWVSAWV